jgi:hypothetical protein
VTASKCIAAIPIYAAWCEYPRGADGNETADEKKGSADAESRDENAGYFCGTTVFQSSA